MSNYIALNQESLFLKGQVLFGLSTIGLFLYILYPVALISISMYVSRTKEVTSESYFFANRNKHWLLISLSLITPWLSSPYLLGLTSSANSFELITIYGLISAIMLFLLGWFFVPKYAEIKINTLPEFFEKRYNRTCKFFLSSLYILSNIFVRLIIILVIGSIFIDLIGEIDPYSSLLFFLVITGIYVIIGGLQTEIYVNIIQVLFIILGIIGFSGWILNQEAGFRPVINKISTFENTSLGLTELILSYSIVGFWFWCADQSVVQKILSVRNINHTKKTSLASGFLQIIPVFICVLAVLITTFSQGESSENILQTMFSSGLIPESLRGGLIIAVAAILMTSFASLFNSTSVLITFDFYKTFRPTASDRKLVLVGRLTTMFLVLIAILLLPISQSIEFSLAIKLFKAFTYLVSMVAAVFLVGLFNKKINGISALVTLCTGSLIILVKAVFEIIFINQPVIFGNTIINLFLQAGFFEFSIFIFFFSILCLFVFNKLELVQHITSSFLRIIKGIFLKLKYRKEVHQTVFFILSVLIVIILWLTLI